MLGLAAPRAHGQGRLSSSVRAAMTPTTAPFACYNGQVVLATGHPRRPTCKRTAGPQEQAPGSVRVSQPLSRKFDVAMYAVFLVSFQPGTAAPWAHWGKRRGRGEKPFLHHDVEDGDRHQLCAHPQPRERTRVPSPPLTLPAGVDRQWARSWQTIRGILSATLGCFGLRASRRKTRRGRPALECAACGGDASDRPVTAGSRRARDDPRDLPAWPLDRSFIGPPLAICTLQRGPQRGNLARAGGRTGCERRLALGLCSFAGRNHDHGRPISPATRGCRAKIFRRGRNVRSGSHLAPQGTARCH